MMARKEQIVRGLTQGIAGLFKKNKITRLTGTGRARSRRGASPSRAPTARPSSTPRAS